MRALLKRADATFMAKYAVRVRRQAKDSPLWEGFFGATDLLVPVPRSTPYIAGRLWAAEELALALVSEGLGACAWAGLRRVHAVRKSATAPPNERPTVFRHYESFLFERPPVEPERVVLVDDVITKGRTLLAAASVMHDAFPRAEIKAFALVRTMGLAPGVHQLLDPCKGEIRWKSGDAHRSP
jgi:predicted amidophosphoribosyltransferase